MQDTLPNIIQKRAENQLKFDETELFAPFSAEQLPERIRQKNRGSHALDKLFSTSESVGSSNPSDANSSPIKCLSKEVSEPSAREFSSPSSSTVTDNFTEQNATPCIVPTASSRLISTEFGISDMSSPTSYESGKSNSYHIPPTAHSSPTAVAQIPINSIIPNPNQPRKSFAEASIIKLADSIRQFGIIQPLTVRKLGHLYQLIAGERRLRAAKELGLSTVPCIIREVSEEKSAQMSIIENLLRQDLNIFEQAVAIQSLIDTYSLTQEQIAEKLSTSQSYIANKLRLLRFSQEERDIILSCSLSERHARALLRISDQNLRDKALESVIKNDLNVSSTEELVRSIIDIDADMTEKPQSKPKAYKDIPAFFNAVTRAIDCAKISNLGIKCRKIVGDCFTELTIIIPNTDPNQ